jgi:transcriptional regulator with PAS, ATPase and Fis domain
MDEPAKRKRIVGGRPYDTSRPSEILRWRSWRPFQRAAEPIFVFNRHGRIVFVNSAWQQLTGLPLAEARQITCRPRRAVPDSWEALLGEVLRPPDEVSEGRPAHVRRPVPRFDPARRWWDIDFLPFRDAGGLLFIIGRITTSAALTAAGPAALPEGALALREAVLRRYDLEAIASELPAMRRVADQVRLAARVRVPVLIVGERGAGKEWLARTIHALGDDRRRPFVTLDCARLTPAAVAGVLFGEGELAQATGAGTVYLREPSRLPRDLQQRLGALLAADDARGPRFLAGLRADPDDEERAGRLLDELAARLATLAVRLPPLRERRDDLARLAERLLERAGAATGKQVRSLTPAAWEALRSYPWPGNVAELYAVLAGACGRAAGERIDAADLPLYLRVGPRPAMEERPLPLKELLEGAERRLIGLALRRAGGNKSRAAELLAVWRPLLLRRMAALGIDDLTPPRRKRSHGADPET